MEQMEEKKAHDNPNTTIQKKRDTMNSSFNDTTSVISDASRYTGYVSTIASSEYQLNDALVAIIGISEYDGLPNLDGVIKDYENVIKTFSTHWKYNVLFQLKNNRYIYTNDIEKLKLNENKDYKLKWNGDDIDGYVKETRKHIIQQKHNGLIFVISCHGDRGRIMYDSDCEEYELDAIFSMYQPNASALVENYKETKEESNYLSQIPKIFVLDMCRGSMSAKPLNTSTEKQHPKAKQKKQDKIAKKDSEEKEIQTPPANVQEMKDSNKSQSHNTNRNKNEKLTFKGVSKDVASQLASQASNFFKMYATPEGYAVASGTQGGGLFLRNFCKVFKDKEFIYNHYWDEIVLKISEYTKREATIISNLVEFIQVVEIEGTLEKKLKFFNKMDDLHILDDEYQYSNAERKLLLTNLSTSERIAVLIEYENSSEDRGDLLNDLSNDNTNDHNLFKKYNFKMIEPNGAHCTFDKPYSDRVFITVFVMGHHNIDVDSTNNMYNKAVEDGYNTEMYDRFETKEDFLYFENDSLNNLVDLRLKCNLNSKHNLAKTRVSMNSGECKDCGIVAIGECNDYSFVCRKCKYELCQNCCHKMVLVKRNIQEKPIAMHMAKQQSLTNSVNKKDQKQQEKNSQHGTSGINNSQKYDDTKEEKENKSNVNEDHYKDNYKSTNKLNFNNASSKRNNIRWRFDFFYDSYDRQSAVHGIENNYTCIKCKHDGSCYCFAVIKNVGMQSNSGIYQIKLKINEISNDNFTYGNIVGLVSDCNFIKPSKKGNYKEWFKASNDWIGWSACQYENNIHLPNGLFCGYGDAQRRDKNMFRKNGFVYNSHNGKYLSKLPAYRSGDIVVLTYNSDIGQLSFKLFKKNTKNNNDKNDSNYNNNNHGTKDELSSVDSYISNLPGDLTFYWFFGHVYKSMSITIVD